MAYQVLARRYRPQTFQDLIGQEHVTVTLRNAVVQNRLAHAYLFTGPRGVGKTSAARILAKAIRCLQPASDGEPCNQCEACQSTTDGSSLDVIEIDAASNTGVDNIRNLRENIEYMAAVGRYRVYIIDEVHMLSTAAFNALLKTLEEPPAHVIFLFATTEIHKVLATIQSRCQRFDFKRIPMGLMVQHLKIVCTQEKISIEESALQTVARESEGCLRDALSLLDQVIALCGTNITQKHLEESLGLMDRASLLTLAQALGNHQAGQALKCVSDLFEKGVDPKVFLSRWVELLSELHYFTFTGNIKSGDPQQVEILKPLAQGWTNDEIIRSLDLAVRVQSQLHSTSSAQILAESFIVKLALMQPVALSAGTAASPPSSDAQPVLAESPRATVKPPSPAPTFSAARKPMDSPSASPKPLQTTPVAALASAEGQTLKSKLEHYLRASKPAWTPVLNSIVEMTVRDSQLVLRARADFAGKRLASNDGAEVLKKALGVTLVKVDLENSIALSPVVNPVEKIQQKRSLAKSHEAVTEAMSLFGATVTETKVLDDEKGDMK
jgi:DNA polymerase-3 subunit gamma/tau